MALLLFFIVLLAIVPSSSNCLTFSFSGMFDGGSAAAPVPARNESTPVVGGNDTRERRSNLRGESDPGLTGVVGVGVRSNSVSGEDNDEEESAVSSSQSHKPPSSLSFPNPLRTRV